MAFWSLSINPHIAGIFCLEETMTSKPVSPVVYRDRAFLDKHPDLGRLPE